MFSVPYKKLCELCFEKKSIDYVVSKIQLEYELSNSQKEIVKKNLSKTFFPNFERNFNKVGRKVEKFRQRYFFWMENNLNVEINFDSVKPSASKLGRPAKLYDFSSKRSKRRKIQKIRDGLTDAELKHLSVQQSGSNNDFKCSDEEALALYVDMDLTKSKYIKMKKFNDKKIGKFYPIYDKILIQKKKCYPNNVEIGELFAKVELQSLLNHTAERIILSVKKEDIAKFNNKQLILKRKWGMDGSSGQQTFKQKFADNDKEMESTSSSNPTTPLQPVSNKQSKSSSEKASSFKALKPQDSSIFILCFSPLKIATIEKDVLWTNIRPSSTRYCL